jgi:hypothetical protein
MTKDLTVFMFDIPPRIINQIHQGLNMNDHQIQANLTVFGQRGDTNPLLKLKVLKQNGEIQVDAESVKASMGLSEDDWQKGLEVISSTQYLKPDEAFVHPLADVSVIDGKEMLNMYAVGMIFINCIRRIPSDDGNFGNPEQAEKFLTNLLFQAKPEADSQALIGKIKLHDKAAMMMLCTYLNEFKPKL